MSGSRRVPDPDPELDVSLDIAVPERLALGRGNAIFVLGSCAHRTRRVEGLEIEVEGRRVPVAASAMPRLDREAYRSGFWAIVPFGRRELDADVGLSVVARLAGGGERTAPLGEVRLAPNPEPAVVGGETIAICMATHNPDPGLFETQIASIREQSDRDWVCVVSDDCSDPQSFERIGEVLSGDARFSVSRSGARLGFYRNFERALGLAPPTAGLVAIADQDDRWHPGKLATLREALGPARLVYSDQRVVTPGGEVLSGTYWSKRRNNHTNLASLLISNTVTGAASLMRHDLLDDALPFPEVLGEPYHDHWLGLVALCSGEIAYVDRPLYDYVQHENAVLGHAGANTVEGRSGMAWLGRLKRGERPAVGWRSLYFFEYCRLALFATVLLLRCGERMPAAKRAALESFLGAESSPRSFAWLASRSARALLGHNETLGAERRLAAGIVWRHALPLLAGARRGRHGRLAHDASLPDRPPRDRPQPQ